MNAYIIALGMAGAGDTADEHRLLDQRAAF
jgi:hypothetical protein